MKLRNYLYAPTIIHILYWLVSCLVLYLLTGISLPAGVGSSLAFLALFVSLIGYYLGAGLLILVQTIGLIGVIHHVVKREKNTIPSYPNWLWRVANIGINATLLFFSPYHELLIGWLSI